MARDILERVRRCRSVPTSRRRAFSSPSAAASASLHALDQARSWNARASRFGLARYRRRRSASDLVGHRLGFARQQVAADPLPDRIERDARDPAGMIVRRRCRRRGTVRAAGRTGARGLPARGAGRLDSRIERRNSCSTSSAPGVSSPRSRPRSSSAISRAARFGFSSRRYCRKRSTSSASAIPLPIHRFTPGTVVDSAAALRTRLGARVNASVRRIGVSRR